MSLMRRILNPYLRLTEKPHLARAKTPKKLRDSFELKAKLFFHGPRGAAYRDDKLAGVPVRWVLAPGVQEADAPLLLYFHGGGYVFGSPRTHQAMLAHLSGFTGAPACLPDYGKAPEHPFPAAVDDALATYRAVMDRPGGVVLGGDSAGGGLALALLSEVLRQDMVPPLGVFAFSPLTDMTYSGDSIVTNAQVDVELPASRIDEMAGMYLGAHDPADPRASPLFADFTGAPLVWLVAGDTEILLDDTRRMAERLRAQGVVVNARIAHDLPHVWPLFHNLLPEARATLRDVAGWISSLSRPSGGS